VPGYGDDRPGVILSAMGRLRIELAARRYKEGKAPLIVVSGGFVHPARTPQFGRAVRLVQASFPPYFDAFRLLYTASTNISVVQPLSAP
jgi:hypothetical protein